MRSYDDLKAEMESNNESAISLKKVKCFFENYVFSTRMLKGSLSEGWKKS